MQDKLTYKDSGVDIEEGYKLVDSIKPMIAKTKRPGVMSSIGGFGGLFELDLSRYQHPILVSGTDGVGTKLKLAFELKQHNTVGIDLVAMCVNDVLTCGAEPLFFLDYFATGLLDANQASEVIQGISVGCQQAGAALIGGETAEMPGFYNKNEYDLAGFTVGCVNKHEMITGEHIAAGDVLIGLPSSGLHSNGFSLVRKLLERENINIHQDELNGQPWRNILLEPTRIYVKTVLELCKKFDIKGMAHITGGGLVENIPRMLDKSLAAKLNLCWEVPSVFQWLKEKANLSTHEWLNTFNCGIGFVIVVKTSEKNNILEHLRQNQENAIHVGEIISKTSQSIELEGLS